MRIWCQSVLGLFLILQNGIAGPVVEEVKISEHPVFLVVSYDGFRHDYLNKVSTPVLDALRAEGVYAPYMEPAFPTKTFPNHQSIATGLYTESHGIVENSFFDPLYNKTLSGYNDDPGFWNYREDVLPLWIHNEMAGEGRVSGALMWPGSSQPYGANNDSLPTYYYPGYNGSVPWEERVDTVISWITNDTKPANLVFLYFEEPDTKGHGFGPDNLVTLEEVAKADVRTAYLIEKLKNVGIFDKINLIILSDHGMAGVSQQRISHLEGVIDNSLYAGKYGSTPMLQFISKEGKQDELYESLKVFCQTKNCTAWKKGELRNPYYYATSRRVLDITLIADPGYAFDDFEGTIKYYNSRYNLTEDPTREYGVHGYINAHTTMRPIFLAHGPAFQKGIEIPPIKNVDVVPLLSSLMGIPVPPNNGTLERVAKMINPEINTLSSTGNMLNTPFCISLLLLVIMQSII